MSLVNCSIIYLNSWSSLLGPTSPSSAISNEIYLISVSSLRLFVSLCDGLNGKRPTCRLSLLPSSFQEIYPCSRLKAPKSSSCTVKQPSARSVVRRTASCFSCPVEYVTTSTETRSIRSQNQYFWARQPLCGTAMLFEWAKQ